MLRALGRVGPSLVGMPYWPDSRQIRTDTVPGDLSRIRAYALRLLSPSYSANRPERPRVHRSSQESNMDTTTLLIILIVLLVLGGGYYGRRRWF